MLLRVNLRLTLFLLLLALPYHPLYLSNQRENQVDQEKQVVDAKVQQQYPYQYIAEGVSSWAIKDTFIDYECAHGGKKKDADGWLIEDLQIVVSVVQERTANCNIANQTEAKWKLEKYVCKKCLFERKEEY